ncbi:ABC transporter permease subunit [Candidatus Poribacteria bacterium]|nr:ABC transporter permease subunit [Candidatus Poribacteria bacterium]
MWNIIKKELAANLLSFRFILIFLLCFTLIMVSTYTMRGKYNESLKEYSAAVKIHKAELEEAEGAQGLNQAAINGYKLDKPPAPLSVIVEGMEGAAGNYTTINILSSPVLEGGSGSDPMFAYFGTLDIMYIVRVVLSLVAILLTYDAISGEKEQGTLKLALSNSVPRANVLLAKCIGGYLTILLPFLIPLLIGFLILTSSGSIDFSNEEWIRISLILLVSLLYIGVFLMLGVMVSSRTNHSTTSLMTLLFIWVVVVLAVPKVSMLVAGKIKDVPSIQEIQAEKDTAMNQIMNEQQEKIQKYFAEHRNEMGDTNKRMEVMAEVGEMQEEMFNNISKKKSQIDLEYESKKAEQFRLASILSRISPASVYTYASTNLARTGFNRQERFMKAARIYQVSFVQYFNEMMNQLMTRVGRGQGENQEELNEIKFDVSKLPNLDFREANLSESWNAVYYDFIILFLLLACLFMIGYVGFVRSDIR